ncbi:MAG: exodeoxyribonuclease VII large subunit, partial [Desulfocurvibacter africanus]
DQERLSMSGWQMMRRKQEALGSLVAALGRQYGSDRWAILGGRVDLLAMRLAEGGKRALGSLESDLRMLETRLESLDPEKPLARGYSLVRVERTGRFLRDPDDVVPDDRLEIRVRNGVVPAIVVKGKE